MTEQKFQSGVQKVIANELYEWERKEQAKAVSKALTDKYDITKKKSNKPFPKYMKHKNTGAVLRFTAYRYGYVIKSYSDKVGTSYYVNDMGNYEDCEITIEVK